MNDRTRSIVDWNILEKKWSRKWETEKSFQADIDSTRKKYFVTVAYPYPNSPQHIGHGRTYTLADAHARYMRMRGYNVLFPMGFHYTGTPILAMSRRVASQDEELLETFRTIYNISDDAIQSFINPVNIAKYFHTEIKHGMKEMGYSIDWRCEFTTIDELYSKFISWQFRLLKSKGLIVQGSHPVGWCPKDQNPVSQHDTIGDVEPEFNEYVLIKFRVEFDGSYYILPAATLRPETIYGATNLWLNPEITYVLVSLNDHGEKWIISPEAARKLEFLNRKLSIHTMLSGKELMGKHAENLVTHDLLPIYPASFVKPDNGTGVVMSVPGHAPYDYQALDDLKTNKSILDKFNLGKIVDPISIIDSGQSQKIETLPALEVIRKYHIVDQTDKRLEDATNELYLREFHKGKMMSNTGKYVGMSVSEAKEKIKSEIVTNGIADTMVELINKPIRCRCGAECVVKILNDQWFINYGDQKWKSLAHKCINNMDILPEEIRQEFNNVIDWLRERACARKSGLGTKLPWDTNWIIESLSDSVIYMAYYIIAKYNSNLNNMQKLNPHQINDSFFDYLLLGKGDSETVAKECNVSINLVEGLRDEFCYFYPVDTRHSGRDLVANHLSFFVFNHVAIFDERKWPLQIVVNGSVLMQGKKMSKSLGNIVPLRKAIKEHGADAIRIAMLISAELLQDADFSFDTLEGIKSKLNNLYHMTIESSSSTEVTQIKNENSNELEDKWLNSRLQKAISEITLCMDKLRVREALHILLYTLDQDLLWHKKRACAKKRQNISIADIILHFLDTRIRMLSPFAPFISEEIWEKIGNPYSIISGGWPVVDNSKIDPITEESEHLIMNLISDIQTIIKVTKIRPSKIVIYVAAHWKTAIYRKVIKNIVLEHKTNFGDIMRQLVTDPSTLKSKTDPDMVRKTIEDILSETIEVRTRRISLKSFDEIPPIKDAATLICSEIGNAQAQIQVYSEDDIDLQKHDPKSKAKFARPFKPAIYMQE